MPILFFPNPNFGVLGLLPTYKRKGKKKRKRKKRKEKAGPKPSPNYPIKFKY